LAWLSGIVADAAALAIAVPGGAVVYWAALRLFSRQSARVVDAVLAALVRRDRAGLRAALGGAAGSRAPGAARRERPAFGQKKRASRGEALSWTARPVGRAVAIT